MARISPVNVLSNATKARSLGIGMVAGLGVSEAARALLISPEGAARLERDGKQVMSDREVRASVGPLAFVFAAATGTGLGRRSNSAALTTVSLGAAMLLATPNVAAMVNSGTEQADEHLRTLGLMTAAAGAGFAVGAPSRLPEVHAKYVGLAALGLAIGTLTPEMLSYVARIPGELQRGYEHRNE